MNFYIQLSRVCTVVLALYMLYLVLRMAHVLPE